MSYMNVYIDEGIEGDFNTKEEAIVEFLRYIGETYGGNIENLIQIDITDEEIEN